MSEIVGGMSFDDVKLPGSKDTKTETSKEKEPTKYWVNVGIERGGKLLTLPMGIPLDKLEAKSIPGKNTKNQEFRNLRIAEKQFWDAFQAQLATFKPGEARKVNLVVEVRRIDERSEPTETEVEENPFAVGELKL